jgi:hypothetical protein
LATTVPIRIATVQISTDSSFSILACYSSCVVVHNPTMCLHSNLYELINASPQIIHPKLTLSCTPRPKTTAEQHYKSHEKRIHPPRNVHPPHRPPYLPRSNVNVLKQLHIANQHTPRLTRKQNVGYIWQAQLSQLAIQMV